MIETIFYLQVALFFILLVIAVFTRSAPFFALAGVISLLLGVQLAAGEPVEFFTGNYTFTKEDGGTYWTGVHDLNRMTVLNSPQVDTWHYLLLYGGFVWLLIAFILSIRGNETVRGMLGYGNE